MGTLAVGEVRGVSKGLCQWCWAWPCYTQTCQGCRGRHFPSKLGHVFAHDLLLARAIGSQMAGYEECALC